LKSKRKENAMKMKRKSWMGMVGGLCLTAATIGATRLWAQSDAPKIATAEEAAQSFVFLLNNPGAVESRSMDNLFSKKLDELEAPSLGHLWTRMATRAQLSRFKAQSVPGETPNRTTVLIEPSETAEIPPIVCVREDGGWKIDLLETGRKLFGAADADVVALDQEMRGEYPEPIAREKCATNLKQISLAMLQYTQDYDEMLPPAKNWADVMKPYFKNERVLHAPEVGKASYGYAMNWKLSRQPLAQIEDVTKTVAFYESNILKRNQSFDGRDLIYRHLLNGVAGANYAFVDGSVKWHSQRDKQDFRLMHPKIKNAKAIRKAKP